MQHSVWRVPVLVLVISSVLFSISGFAYARHRSSQQSSVAPIFDSTEVMRQRATELIGHQTISAEGYYVGVLNKKTGLFEDILTKNPDQSFVSASLAKLMTVYVAARDLQPNWSVQLKKDIPVPQDMPLYRVKLESAIRAALVQSSNTAAYGIASRYHGGVSEFVTQMNNTAKELGLHTAQFRDPSGYDFRDTQRASYISPREVVQLAYVLWRDYPQYAQESILPVAEIKTKDSKQSVTIKNTNTLLPMDSAARLSKTGYTFLSGGNLVMLFEYDPDTVMGVAVMKSSKTNRYMDVATLSGIARDAYRTSIATSGGNILARK